MAPRTTQPSVLAPGFAVCLLALLCWTAADALFHHSIIHSRTCGARRRSRGPLSATSKSVGLTRERGENDKLRILLEGIECFEVPCIQFEEGPDVAELKSLMVEFDMVAITSPQAAKVFLNSWSEAGKPEVKVVSVGKGTSKPLIAAGISPVFEPSDATGVTLASELPSSLGKSVLYPSSSLADNKLVDGLKSGGFEVKRINTYTTAPATWTENDYARAKSIDVVALGSPSAVKVWAERVGTSSAQAVVIGPTSARAAEDAGFDRIHAPSGGSKGLGPWADLIRQVATTSS